MSEEIRYQTSIRDLFHTAFGLATTVYFTGAFLKQSPENIGFDGMEMLPSYYNPGGRSWMGTPIMFPTQFKGGSYKRYKPNGEIERVQMPDFKFPAATMFSFRRAHNVTRTNLLGSNGTVKEIYGFDDWVIDVKGICLDEPKRSAHDQLKELLQWEKLADSVSLSGELFEQREISRVTLSDWSDGLEQGTAGVIPFQFQLWSDEDIILTL